MAFYKTIVNLFRDANGNLLGRTRHCDGRKVVMHPQIRNGNLELRGMGYDAEETKKIVAHPMMTDEGLKFRTITECPCPECWDCTTYTPEDIIANPKPYTSLRVRTSGWMDDCCGDELDGLWFDLAACPPVDRDTRLWDESLTLVGGCDSMPWSYRYPAAEWYGEYYVETVHECDDGVNDVIWWQITTLLRTMCAFDAEDNEEMWVWLRMLFEAKWYPWVPDSAETCCLPYSGFEASIPGPDTYNALYEGCQKLTNLTRLCGNFLGTYNLEMWHYNPRSGSGAVDCGNAFTATIDLPEE